MKFWLFKLLKQKIWGISLSDKLGQTERKSQITKFYSGKFLDIETFNGLFLKENSMPPSTESADSHVISDSLFTTNGIMN